MKSERRLSCGLTEIVIKTSSSKSTYEVTHLGNMGNSLKDIEKNVDKLLGLGVFNSLVSKAKTITGSPDYCWEMVTELSAYKKA